MASLKGAGTSLPNLNLNGSKFVTKHPICSVSPRKASVSVSVGSSSSRFSCSNSRIMASSSVTETQKLGIKIVKNPPESKLSDLGVRSWPKWGCPPSKFPWTYSARETCYLLKGKVKVYPDGSDEAVEIGAGDLVVFPNGMSCTWDVSEAVDKHYKFD
ncbi:hypothetical protein ACS0TY_028102 [Phlomoides rotata]